MKNRINPPVKLLLVTLRLCLTACGHGGDGTSALDRPVISLSLVGDSATIGSLQFDLIFPQGFSLPTDAQGQLAADVVTTVAASEISFNYLPEDALNLAQLTLARINANGFLPGQLATLTWTPAAGETLPQSSDFTISNLLVTDINGVDLTGYSLEISVQPPVRIP